MNWKKLAGQYAQAQEEAMAESEAFRSAVDHNSEAAGWEPGPEAEIVAADNDADNAGVSLVFPRGTLNKIVK